MSSSSLSTTTVTVLICVNYITLIHSSALSAGRQGDLPFGFNQKSPGELKWIGEVPGREPTTMTTANQQSSSCGHGVNGNGNGCANPPLSPPDIHPENVVIRTYPSRTGNALANRLAIMHHPRPSTEDANRGPVNLKTSRMLADVSLIFKFVHLIEALFNLLAATLWAN